MPKDALMGGAPASPAAPKGGKPYNWASNAPTDEKIAAGWRYVTLPAKNPVFSKADYPVVTINNMKFLAGHSYLVPPLIADTVEERMKTFHREQIRLLQPDQDATALNDLNVGQHNGTRDFSYDAEQFAVAAA